MYKRMVWLWSSTCPRSNRVFSMVFVILFWIGILGCKPPSTVSSTPVDLIRYETLEEALYLEELKLVLPNVTVDASLQKAAQTLIAASRETERPMSVRAMLDAENKAGYPGQAHFIKVMNGGQFPAQQLRSLSKYRDLEVGMSKRKFADGKVLWIIGWGRRLLEIDPIPLEIPLDGVVPIRIGDFEADRALLYISAPDRPVERIELLPNAHRWLQAFHVPGEYRFEVLLQHVEGASQYNEIALLFSVFVDTPIPNVTSSVVQTGPNNPILAEKQLFQAVNQLRSQRGLRPLIPFDLFVPLAREHSALMASTGIINHKIVGITNGVPSKAANLAHPRASHHQNVAAALTADEALTLAKDSPGHFQVFLCETCTHMSIGVALEPTFVNPRLFVTWEVLEFQQGVPMRIEKLNRDF